MINDDTIAMMKKGVVLINTSRGALIDSNALLRGIKDRKIGAALANIADTTLANVSEYFENNVCANEICYHCEKVGSCPQAHAHKCF